MSFYIHERFNDNLNLGSIYFPGQAICAIKDLNHQFVATNNKTANLLGFKDAKSLINSDLSDNDLFCNAKSLSEQFRREDALVQQDQTITTLTHAQYADGQYRMLLTEKSVYESEVGEKIGYFIYSLDLSNHHILNMPGLLNVSDSELKLQQFSKIIYPSYPGIRLTDRQAQCLYFILNGYSSAEIALITNLSKRTVESYVEHLKDKFHCTSKRELIEHAIARGYLDIIPRLFLQ
jgi:DNA-binding CsgD family transcriptional regulator